MGGGSSTAHAATRSASMKDRSSLSSLPYLTLLASEAMLLSVEADTPPKPHAKTVTDCAFSAVAAAIAAPVQSRGEPQSVVWSPSDSVSTILTAPARWAELNRLPLLLRPCEMAVHPLAVMLSMAEPMVLRLAVKLVRVLPVSANEMTANLALASPSMPTYWKWSTISLAKTFISGMSSRIEPDSSIIRITSIILSHAG